MKRQIYKIIYSLIVALFFSLQTVQAHEFIVKPGELSTSVSRTIPIEVLSAHVFMESEEIEPLEQVETYSITPTSRLNIPLQPNKSNMTLQGNMKIGDSGTHILCGHRKGIIWSKTTQGWKQESKKNLTGVISSGLYEKFSKAIVINGEKDKAFSKPVGHKLEIVPLEDPSTTQVDKEISFQILYDGKPLTTEVYATYDGFSTHPNTYAYFSKSDKNGQATVKITHPGAWMIRVQHEINAPTEDYDKQTFRAVLLFGVKS